MEKRNRLIHKIAIVGPESSGKTQLSKQLSSHFQEPWVSEFAREYLENHGANYEKIDLDFFAEEQVKKEAKTLKKASQFLFCDTNALSIKVWSLYKYGNFSNKIQSLVDESYYDLSLLLYPNLKYEPDPLREDSPLENRLELFDLFRKEMEKAKLNYMIIKGEGKERLQNALNTLYSDFS